MMKTLFTFILYYVCIAFALADITTLSKNHKENYANTSVEPNDCELIIEEGKAFMRCALYISSKAPAVGKERIYLDGANAFKPDNVTPDINLDYTLKISMNELQRGPDGEVEVCLAIVSVAFQRVWKKEKKRRIFPIASRIFNVVANAEMISLEVKLVKPLFGGRAKIESGCYDSMRSFSSCITDLDLSLNPTITDSSEEEPKGVVDFNVLSYGYTHISLQSYQNNLGKDFKLSDIPNLPDKTRRGKKMLEYIPGENLAVLKFPKNKWSSLDTADVKFFPKLEVLDLSENEFETFETDIFKEVLHLKELYFSENNLTSIPGLIANQSDLRVLNIGGNNFDYDEDSGVQVLMGYISNLLHMEILNISGFRIKILKKDTFPQLPELKELYASYCGIYSVEKNAFHNVPNLEKIDLSSNSLNSLPNNVFFPLEHLKILDVSFNKFTEGLGLQFSSHMDLLDMSSTSMSSTKDLIANGSKVRKINLSNNVLKNLKELKISYGDETLVEELDLSSNLIPALSSKECNTLSTLKLLNISENKFNCDDCNLLDFQLWLIEANSSLFTSPPQDFICALPTLSGKRKTRVIDAEYNEDCIGLDVIIISGGTFSGLVLIIALIGGIIYLYRFEISYILHLIKVKRRSIKGEGKPHSECVYDAFVSYSGHDRNWVLRVLQPELEEGEEKYQLCLHDRNFTLGGIITQNIIDSIEKSRKTILILSKGFVDSQWCRWELEMANHKLFHDSRDFLVLVELDRLDRKDLPRHLRFLMETRTYLEWPSREKLRTSNLESGEDMADELRSHSTSTTDAKVYEQSVAVFWRRLREALGDSLRIKELKAREEAEIVIRRSRLRDDGNFVVYRRTLERPVEEAEL